MFAPAELLIASTGFTSDLLAAATLQKPSPIYSGQQCGEAGIQADFNFPMPARPPYTPTSQTSCNHPLI